MAPRKRIGYVIQIPQLDSAIPLPPISDKLDALGKNDNSKRDLPTPEFDTWCTSARHKLNFSGPGGVAQINRDDVLRLVKVSFE